MTRFFAGVVNHSFPQRKPKDTLEFIEYCNTLGAGGVQMSISSTDPAYVRRVRERCEQLGMFFEAQASLPGADTAQFSALLSAARDAGALCVRTACLSGRRYETFSTLQEWKRFDADSRAAIERALPIAEKLKLPLAIENHKDRTVDELAALLRGYSSEYLGVTLDTGNNMALLDNPMEVVERLAPYAVSTHFKDMAVDLHAEGFLLAEVPFGEGILDLRRMLELVRKARPRTKFSIEMITRDPLKIPCLTEKYWATFPDRPARYLASTLSFVSAHKRMLPIAGTLDAVARLKREQENVSSCLRYAQEKLI